MRAEELIRADLLPVSHNKDETLIMGAGGAVVANTLVSNCKPIPVIRVLLLH